MAHAFYDLNEEYRIRAMKAMELIPKDQEVIIHKILRSYGYDDTVLVDETHAFLIHFPKYFQSAEWDSYGLDYHLIEPIHLELSNNFQRFRSDLRQPQYSILE